MHVHFSGYVGDAICGPTFSDIETVQDLYRTLPYYGTGLGMTGAEAHERILQLVRTWTALTRARRSTRTSYRSPRIAGPHRGGPGSECANRSSTTSSSISGTVFPPRIRGEERLYERLLLARYPKLFRSIPHQKTGVPVLAPRLRRELTRTLRYALRKTRISRGPRQYHDDLGHTGGTIRQRIEETILGEGSLCCEILERKKVASSLARGSKKEGSRPGHRRALRLRSLPPGSRVSPASGTLVASQKTAKALSEPFSVKSSRNRRLPFAAMRSRAEGSAHSFAIAAMTAFRSSGSTTYPVVPFSMISLAAPRAPIAAFPARIASRKTSPNPSWRLGITRKRTLDRGARAPRKRPFQESEPTRPGPIVSLSLPAGAGRLHLRDLELPPRAGGNAPAPRSRFRGEGRVPCIAPHATFVPPRARRFQHPLPPFPLSGIPG